MYTVVASEKKSFEEAPKDASILTHQPCRGVSRKGIVFQTLLCILNIYIYRSSYLCMCICIRSLARAMHGVSRGGGKVFLWGSNRHGQLLGL